MNRTEIMAKVKESAIIDLGSQSNTMAFEMPTHEDLISVQKNSYTRGAQFIIDGALAEAEKIANDNTTSCELLSQEIDRLREHLAEANKEIAALNSRVQELIHIPQNEFQKQCLHEVSVALKISAESEAKLAEAEKENERLQNLIKHTCQHCGDKYTVDYNQRFHDKTCHNTLSKQIDRANARELAEAQKDSRRLEWAINNSSIIYALRCQGFGAYEDPRAAIDAAIAEEKKK